MPRSTWAATPAMSPTKPVPNRPRRTGSISPRRRRRCAWIATIPRTPTLQKAHNNQPFGTANCVECHDPHQSDPPKLMAKFQHVPFQANGCDTCHAPAKDGKVVLTQADVKVALRYLPRRQGQADRQRQGAASRRGRRLHRLPQPARQQPARPAQDRFRQHLPGLPQRHRRSAQEARPSPACLRPGLRHLPHSAWRR